MGPPARRTDSRPSRRAALALKRALDVVGSLGALAVLAPLMLATALAIGVADGRPVLFRQVRPGAGGRPFAIVKFRTMRPLRPGEAPYFSDHQRVTTLGRVLRTTSLDELPELWNVLRGDMSLVGPRPLLMEYLDHYTPEEARRHDMRPGITGWAVVNGRNALPFRERLKLDVWYVDNWSLRLDAVIVLRTLWQVFRRWNAHVTEDDVALGFPLEPSPDATATRGEPRGDAWRRRPPA